ncbi:MAG TPA: hypothetical protein VMH22_12220 [bacterium]|nr:hypothetical protein [bacterium]
MVRNRVQSFLALSAGLVLMASFSCNQNRRPDAPAAPAGPNYCITETTYTFTTVATDPDGDSVQVRFDWGDSSVSHWVGWFASGETVAMAHAWSDTGSFTVHAWAQDQQLLTSDSSEGLLVEVAELHPPDMPDPPGGPDLGYPDTTYTFTTGAQHPDGLPVAIRFAWGDGDTSDWSDFGPAGYPVYMKHSWSVPDSYEVMAQAKDTDGLMSAWSAPHTIVIRGPVQLQLVGAPALSGDSSSFMIHIGNAWEAEDTIRSLEFFQAPESTYMRIFLINGSFGTGYPIPIGLPGTGRGDTVRFAPVTVGPSMSQTVELDFLDFFVDSLGTGPKANVQGKQFVLRFDDGSELTVQP